MVLLQLRHGEFDTSLFLALAGSLTLRCPLGDVLSGFQQRILLFFHGKQWGHGIRVLGVDI